ncbi:DsbA family protein [Streptomyces xanthophaeus]|uniref:DsbA family protein n=1 Tax=Streptomyces xanthophaeus TaxID=67385 RepID=UPI002647AFFB|nr:thioredoxin domain-containing protein [Streptomyces xanthophaeus]WKD31885.1 DsbA family protein [Streptomyces xanthophaeus]
MQIRTVRRLAAAVAWGALAVAAAGCGQGVSATSSTGAAPPASYAGITDLPEALAADGTTITVGDPLAKTVVRLYEDPRCPVVLDFESTGAKAIRAQTFRRQVRTEYTFASFKDDRLGGDGSKRAVNALRAALDGQKFAEYHAVLIGNQTAVEESGGFTTERLLALAEQVPGLRGEAFDTAVSTMKYQDFVTASQSAYRQTGDDPIGPGTPAVVINSKMVPEQFWGFLFEEQLASDLLNIVRIDPVGWQNYRV